MRVGIRGSAGIEGVTETYGIVSDSYHPVVKRAALLWLAAFGVLVAFHVGGSRA